MGSSSAGLPHPSHWPHRVPCHPPCSSYRDILVNHLMNTSDLVSYPCGDFNDNDTTDLQEQLHKL